MKLLTARLLGSLFGMVTSTAILFAQDEPRSVTLPNPMGAHTWFIIAAIGAFLLWCISYTIQLQKEALVKRKGRDELLRLKDGLLDRIADLESRRETNAVKDPQYRRELKTLRHQLAKALESLGHEHAKPRSGERA